MNTLMSLLSSLVHAYNNLKIFRCQYIFRYFMKIFGCCHEYRFDN
nr:MAG TPA: hypothetical protein [Caudoviricetes sp.]